MAALPLKPCVRISSYRACATRRASQGSASLCYFVVQCISGLQESGGRSVHIMMPSHIDPASAYLATMASISAMLLVTAPLPSLVPVAACGGVIVSGARSQAQSSSERASCVACVCIHNCWHGCCVVS